MKELYEEIARLDAERRELLELLIGNEELDLGGEPSETAAELDADEPLSPASSEQVLARVASAVASKTNKDLLVYLHIPFCSSKCHFCDWVKDISVQQLRSGPSVRRGYIEALTKQIRYYGPKLMEMGYEPKFVYWGGGTPTRLEGDEISEVVAALKDSFDLSAVEEHTMETSPETLTPEKLAAMREVGIERVSIGIQSFQDAELRKSGRAHSAAGAEAAVRMVKAAGYENVNLDLIAAFPDQSLEMWKASLEKTIELDPSHITVYLYRPASETVMANQIMQGIKKAVGYDHMHACTEMAQEMLEAAGYIEYTFGYFAKGLDNIFKGEKYYFDFEGDYIGFGSGASSILGYHFLHNQSKDMHRYIEHPLNFDFCARFTPNTLDRIPRGFLLIPDDGLQFGRFRNLFGFDFEEIRHKHFFQDYLEYFKYCGAVFEEDDQKMWMRADTRRKAYILHTSLRLR